MNYYNQTRSNGPYTYNKLFVSKMNSKKLLDIHCSQSADFYNYGFDNEIPSFKYGLGTVDTTLYSRFFRDICFPILDCDSPIDLGFAIQSIDQNYQYNTTVIESSPKRYWVLVDCIGSFNNVRHVLNNTIGIDEHYKRFTNSSKRFHIRSILTYGKVPQLLDNMHCIKNPLILKWIDEYFEFINKQDIILNNTKLACERHNIINKL